MFCGDEVPWSSCDGVAPDPDGWVEKMGYGCKNDDTAYFRRVSKGDKFAGGSVIYDGSWAG